MIPKKSLDSVLDKSIILTITAPNDNAKSISVQCAPPPDFGKSLNLIPTRGYITPTTLLHAHLGFSGLPTALHPHNENVSGFNL